MKERRQGKGLFRTAAAFTLGAAAGSVVALLYAPASGKVTRRRLAMKARNLQRDISRRVGRTTRVLATKAGDVREAATEWISGHWPRGNGRHQAIRHRATQHAH